MHENTAHGIQRTVLGECQQSVTGADGRVITQYSVFLVCLSVIDVVVRLCVLSCVIIGRPELYLYVNSANKMSASYIMS